jgi:hypothetical protein
MKRRTETCSPEERAFLDALIDALPTTSMQCPVCSYNGLPPATPKLSVALAALLRDIGGEDAEWTLNHFV